MTRGVGGNSQGSHSNLKFSDISSSWHYSRCGRAEDAFTIYLAFVICVVGQVAIYVRVRLLDGHDVTKHKLRKFIHQPTILIPLFQYMCHELPRIDAKHKSPRRLLDDFWIMVKSVGFRHLPAPTISSPPILHVVLWMKCVLQSKSVSVPKACYRLFGAPQIGSSSFAKALWCGAIPRIVVVQRRTDEPLVQTATNAKGRKCTVAIWQRSKHVQWVANPPREFVLGC